jgi:hypothetical protein
MSRAGSRNQAGQLCVQADMKTVYSVVAAAAASISILTGCSGQSGPRQTVTGLAAHSFHLADKATAATLSLRTSGTGDCHSG